MITERPKEILLVEDSPTDVMLTVEAFKNITSRYNLHVVRDGEQAMAFLRRESPHAQVPRPDLILLDLNLPKMGGLEVLTDIKSGPRFRHVPVVILTTSESELDIQRAYGLGANCYMSKPVDLDKFEAAIRAIEGFWFSFVKLPA